MIHKKLLLGELRGTPRRSGGFGKELPECLAKQSLAGLIPGLMVPGCRDNLGSVWYLFKQNLSAFCRGSVGSQGFSWQGPEESPARRGEPVDSHRKQGMLKRIHCLFARLGLMAASPL